MEGPDQRNMPSGTITFLFTDVVGSTRLWETAPEAMQSALELHDRILRSVIGEHDGHVFTTAGDSFAVAFASASDAVDAAIEAQLKLTAAAWPQNAALAVRMGLHSGEAAERDGDYFGTSVNRAARVMSAAHGGQIVATSATQDIVADSGRSPAGFIDLGDHRLKDLSSSQTLYQVEADGLMSDHPPLRTLDRVVHNLPVIAEELIGRAEEVDRVRDLLADGSVVTIVGVGGIGKTRLALEAAGSLLDRLPDGICWCELAPVGEGSAVANAIGDALGVPQHPERTMVETIGEYCRSRRLLLILDNCEHVLDAVVEVVDQVRRTAPGVQQLATSREALGIPGERVVLLGPLGIEGPQSPAVALLLARAEAANPNLKLSERDVKAAVEICERLDGMPLAIELAASRARSMAMTDIAERLADAFRLLRGGRGGVERHRTMQAVVDWSYHPLDETSRRLFARLAVFAGSFELGAAEHVCADEDGGLSELDVVDLLDELVIKSLLIVDTTGPTTRYRYLEPIRQYAEDRLADGGEAEATRDRHAAHYLDVAESLSAREFSKERATLQDMQREWPNIRVAVRWLMAKADVDRVARLVYAVEPMLGRTLNHEVGDWAVAALALPGVGDHELGPAVSGVAANSRWWLDDLEATERLVSIGESMPTYRHDLPLPTMYRAVLVRTEGDAEGSLAIQRRIRATDRRGFRVRWLLAMDLATRAAPGDLEEAAEIVSELRAVQATEGSEIAAAMAHQVQSAIFGARGEVSSALEEARESIAAAHRGGSVFVAHINAFTLGLFSSLTDDVRVADVTFLIATLRQQRDFGIRSDLWLTLGGLAAVLQHSTSSKLPRPILRGFEDSVWGQSHVNHVLRSLVSIPPDAPSLEPLTLDELVDAAIEEGQRLADDLGGGR